MPPGVHRKTAKGHVYYYFNTGQKDTAGKPIMKRLPDLNAIDFGPAYSSALRSKSMRAKATTGAMTVRGLVELYEKSKVFASKAPSTKKTYGTYLARLVDMLGPAPAEGIERKDVVLMVDKLADTPGAANMLLAVTGALYKWGRARGHVTTRPVDDIDKFDTVDYEPWPDDLVTAALADEDPFVRRSVALLFYTAQRVGDICALRWSDLRGGRVQIEQEKRKHQMDFPVHTDLLPHLGKPEGLFVLMVNGRQTKTEDVRRRLQSWAAARGHKVVPHGLRKNAVNSLLEAGCSVAETAAVSGQSLQVVEHYAKRRNTGKLGGAAILKWQNGNRT